MSILREAKKAIQKLRSSGQSQRSIAKKLGVSLGAIQRAERGKELSKAMVRKIVFSAEPERKAATELLKELVKERGLSPREVQSRLQSKPNKRVYAIGKTSISNIVHGDQIISLERAREVIGTWAVWDEQPWFSVYDGKGSLIEIDPANRKEADKVNAYIRAIRRFERGIKGADKEIKKFDNVKIKISTHNGIKTVKLLTDISEIRKLANRDQLDVIHGSRYRWAA
jgi:transcriptional regulator with XRE-family HTH domain